MIDNINRQIIAALKSDGRYSYAGLAKDLGINVATVAKRIEKMIQEDVISIRAVLNPFKLGYNAHALITLDIDLTKVDQVCAQFVNNHNISLVVSYVWQVRCYPPGRFSHLGNVTGLYNQRTPQG